MQTFKCSKVQPYLIEGICHLTTILRGVAWLSDEINSCHGRNWKDKDKPEKESETRE